MHFCLAHMPSNKEFRHFCLSSALGRPLRVFYKHTTSRSRDGVKPGALVVRNGRRDNASPTVRMHTVTRVPRQRNRNQGCKHILPPSAAPPLALLDRSSYCRESKTPLALEDGKHDATDKNDTSVAAWTDRTDASWTKVKPKPPLLKWEDRVACERRELDYLEHRTKTLASEQQQYDKKVSSYTGRMSPVEPSSWQRGLGWRTDWEEWRCRKNTQTDDYTSSTDHGGWQSQWDGYAVSQNGYVHHESRAAATTATATTTAAASSSIGPLQPEPPLRGNGAKSESVLSASAQLATAPPLAVAPEVKLSGSTRPKPPKGPAPISKRNGAKSKASACPQVPPKLDEATTSAASDTVRVHSQRPPPQDGATTEVSLPMTAVLETEAEKACGSTLPKSQKAQATSAPLLQNVPPKKATSAKPPPPRVKLVMPNWPPPSPCGRPLAKGTVNKLPAPIETLRPWPRRDDNVLPNIGEPLPPSMELTPPLMTITPATNRLPPPLPAAMSAATTEAKPPPPQVPAPPGTTEKARSPSAPMASVAAAKTGAVPGPPQAADVLIAMTGVPPPPEGTGVMPSETIEVPPPPPRAAPSPVTRSVPPPPPLAAAPSRAAIGAIPPPPCKVAQPRTAPAVVPSPLSKAASQCAAPNAELPPATTETLLPPEKATKRLTEALEQPALPPTTTETLLPHEKAITISLAEALELSALSPADHGTPTSIPAAASTAAATTVVPLQMPTTTASLPVIGVELIAALPRADDATTHPSPPPSNLQVAAQQATAPMVNGAMSEAEPLFTPQKTAGSMEAVSQMSPLEKKAIFLLADATAAVCPSSPSVRRAMRPSDTPPPLMRLPANEPQSPLRSTEPCDLSWGQNLLYPPRDLPSPPSTYNEAARRSPCLSPRISSGSQSPSSMPPIPPPPPRMAAPTPPTKATLLCPVSLSAAILPPPLSTGSSLLQAPSVDRTLHRVDAHTGVPLPKAAAGTDEQRVRRHPPWKAAPQPSPTMPNSGQAAPQVPRPPPLPPPPPRGPRPRPPPGPPPINIVSDMPLSSQLPPTSDTRGALAPPLQPSPLPSWPTAPLSSHAPTYSTSRVENASHPASTRDSAIAPQLPAINQDVPSSSSLTPTDMIALPPEVSAALREKPELIQLLTQLLASVATGNESVSRHD